MHAAARQDKPRDEGRAGTGHLLAQHGAAPDQLLNYFSFVTLATLGYGDVVPRHPAAQTLVMIETVLGQLYVAVVIAWLVGRVALARGEAEPSG